MRFAEIQMKADKLGYKFGTLGYDVLHIVGSASDNASDTVYVENAAEEAAWEEVALSSLAVMLGDCHDKKVCAWFRKIGFRW